MPQRQQRRSCGDGGHGDGGGGDTVGDRDSLTVVDDCYCPNCRNSEATANILPTRIPHFREVVVMCLDCPACGFRNSEVTFGGEMQERGARVTLEVTAPQDLNRQIVKSDTATLLVPCLELEIPPEAQRGSVTTVEGALRRAASDLGSGQPDRLRLGDVDNFRRCQNVIDGINRITALAVAGGGGDRDDGAKFDESDRDEDGEVVRAALTENAVSDSASTAAAAAAAAAGAETSSGATAASFPAFEIVLDDPAGNSFVENPSAPRPDPHLRREWYRRTPSQCARLGLFQQQQQQQQQPPKREDQPPSNKEQKNEDVDGDDSGDREQQREEPAAMEADGPRRHTVETDEDLPTSLGRREVMKFPTACPHCGAHLGPDTAAETTACVVDVPRFGEVVLMCTVCDRCGYRDCEVKGGGGIPPRGTRIELAAGSGEDLKREVLRGDTAGVEIPELDLKLEEGGSDGLYTTVEGLLNKMREQLERANPFGVGDSARRQHLTNDGGEFSDPAPAHVLYRELLQKLGRMADGELLPFTLILTDPLSNSFVGPVQADAAELAARAEREGSTACYESYVDPALAVEEFERTNEQNEMLGLNDIKTENYQTTGGSSSRQQYYGTDVPPELTERIAQLRTRSGPDHPHAVGKAPVEGDTTLMGTKGERHSFPSTGQGSGGEFVS